MLPALDEVVNNYAADNFQESLLECEADKDIWVRLFNLMPVHIKLMRNRNPA